MLCSALLGTGVAEIFNALRMLLNQHGAPAQAHKIGRAHV